MLVNGSVHVPPHTGHFDVGFIDEPSITDTATARPCRLDEQRREALHPPVDRDVVNLDAALGEEFFKIAVRQSVAEVPAHRQQDHVGREPEARKRQRLRVATSTRSHPGTLRPAPDPPTQQRRSGTVRRTDCNDLTGQPHATGPPHPPINQPNSAVQRQAVDSEGKAEPSIAESMRPNYRHLHRHR